jgi:hypothetical protein
MPQLTTTLKPTNKKIVIEGGWEARIPEVTAVDPQTQLAYGRFLQSAGMSPLEAQDEVVRRMSNVFMSAWLRALTRNMRYWASKYARRFPLNINDDGTLRGFNPERLQNTYIPEVNSGKRGSTFANKMFKEFNDAANI